MSTTNCRRPNTNSGPRDRSRLGPQHNVPPVWLTLRVKLNLRGTDGEPDCVRSGSVRGAGEGSRTLANSLEGCCATTTPRPRRSLCGRHRHPLSTNSKVVPNAQDPAGQLSWTGKDLNLRRHMPADLQSATFGHSVTRPDTQQLSRQRDSNPRPEVYKTTALPTELCRHIPPAWPADRTS